MSLKSKASVLCGITIKKLNVLCSNSTYHDSYKNAYNTLSSYSPMASSTSICDHHWDEPKFDLSIIIPAYNSEKWIEQCLLSALNQETSFDYRIIVIDDGSTDRTGKMIDSFSDNDKLIVIHQDNKGYSGARNIALEQIESDYIMFLDSDDYITSNAVEKLISVAKKENADIVERNGFTFNETGRLSTVKLDNNELWGGPCLKVMRSKLWEHIQFPENYIYEDTIISYLIGKQSKKTLFITDELYAYRIHEDSITQKRDINPKRVDSYWILQLVLEEQKKLKIDNESNEDYRQVMRHVIFTYRRTKMLPDEIKKSIFVLTKELLKQKYLSHDYNSTLNRLAKAILTDNYGKYCAICDTINLGKV